MESESIGQHIRKLMGFLFLSTFLACACLKKTRTTSERPRGGSENDTSGSSLALKHSNYQTMLQ